MLDKKHTKTWVKVVAWGLAIVFASSFSAAYMFSGTTTQTGSRPAVAPIADTTPEAQAESLVGQAGIALKNKDYDQAIAFFEQALKLAPGNESAIKGLVKANEQKDRQEQTQDATVTPGSE